MNGPSPPVSPNRKTHRLKIAALIFVGLIAVYFVYRYSLAVSIQARIDAIHHAGFPARCAELDKWYPQPPPGENAADVFKQAFAHYQTWTNKDTHFVVPADARDTNKFSLVPRSKGELLPIVGYGKLPPRTEPLTPEMQKLVAEYLSDNAESLRVLHEAGAMKSSRYPIDLTKGVMTLLPHLSSVRQAARLLELEAIQYTDEQQPQPAIEAVVASLGVSRSLDEDAKIRDAQAALAVERYRLANDKLPSQLSDLVPTFLPAVPSDPFDGKPLRYKTLLKGYVVYSVGEDREDNGGTEKNSKGVSYAPGTDITFTVQR
jgi:hypothetical protein